MGEGDYKYEGISNVLLNVKNDIEVCKDRFSSRCSGNHATILLSVSLMETKFRLMRQSCWIS